MTPYTTDIGRRRGWGRVDCHNGSRVQRWTGSCRKLSPQKLSLGSVIYAKGFFERGLSARDRWGLLHRKKDEGIRNLKSHDRFLRP